MSKWPSAERVRGYWNLGRPQVPPLPAFIVMVDRTTGTEYVLTLSGTSPSLSLNISATLPAERLRSNFGPMDGPYLRGNVRLYVDGGVLLSEVLFPRPGIWGPRVFARRLNERVLLEITADAAGALTYTEVEV